jgi:hypothetical protein
VRGSFSPNQNQTSGDHHGNKTERKVLGQPTFARSDNIFMEHDYYTIQFDYGGVHYNGRVTPETKAGQHAPSSWHVVLNDVFFGYLSRQGVHWNVTEQRPHELVQEVGKQIALHPEAQ